jgi:hypothetical protein
MARLAHTGPIHLGLDVHRDTISVATLPPDHTSAAVERIPSDEAAVLASLAASPNPAACGSVMRPARPAMSWPGCCTPRGSPAR